MNKSIIDAIKETSPQQSLKNKYIIVTCDKLTLKHRFHFQKYQGTDIFGFKDMSNENRTSDTCEKAFVVMIGDINDHFKQPVGYRFVKVKVLNLKKWLRFWRKQLEL